VSLPVRLVRRAWTELTLTWTRPAGMATLLAIGVLSAAWPPFGDAAAFVTIGVVVFLAPREARLARAAHQRRGTPWPSRRSLNIRAGIFALLGLLCLYAANSSFEVKDAGGTEMFLSLAALFAGLVWFHLVTLKKQPGEPPMLEAPLEESGEPASEAPPRQSAGAEPERRA
jgi:hypothetical protein